MGQYKRKLTRQGEITHFSYKAAGTLLLLFIVALSSRSVWSMYGKFKEATQGQQVAQAQLSTLEAQQKTVSQNVANINSSRGTEAELRQRYGVAKPGEGEIRLVAGQATTSSLQSQKGFWSQFWHSVTGQ